ncbi:hypothetical protein CAP35_10865 [Chitinophagaceae bacterium IBVUCB1]|nr:hypothetical protein CAP35_10865 [Chitinophagaceae bacterium IBVUCB1]
MRQNIQDWKQPRYRRPRNGNDKVWFGVSIALIGAFLFTKKIFGFDFDWQTLWPIVLVSVGLLIGVKKRFSGHAWWILMLIGGAHLIPEFTIGDTRSSSLILPIALIIGGIVMILNSKKNKSANCMDKMQVVTTNENQLNIDVTFAGRKEIVTSKDFKGGNINATFGGVEVNMVQADGTGAMVLNCRVSFGGVELIVPSHWEIQNEVQPTLGSVEDRRAMRMNTNTSEEKKVLILKGTCSFGSIEIKSY